MNGDPISGSSFKFDDEEDNGEVAKISGSSFVFDDGEESSDEDLNVTDVAPVQRKWEEGDGGLVTLPEGQTNEWGGNLRNEGRRIHFRHGKDKKVNGYSTTSSSIRQDENGDFVVFPTIIDGAPYGEDMAFLHYKQTGEHWGKAKDFESAKKIAQSVHDRHQEMNGKAWNDYIHENWNKMSEDITKDPGMDVEHRLRTDPSSVTPRERVLFGRYENSEDLPGQIASDAGLEMWKVKRIAESGMDERAKQAMYAYALNVKDNERLDMPKKDGEDFNSWCKRYDINQKHVTPRMYNAAKAYFDYLAPEIDKGEYTRRDRIVGGDEGRKTDTRGPTAGERIKGLLSAAGVGIADAALGIVRSVGTAMGGHDTEQYSVFSDERKDRGFADFLVESANRQSEWIDKRAGTTLEGAPIQSFINNAIRGVSSFTYGGALMIPEAGFGAYQRTYDTARANGMDHDKARSLAGGAAMWDGMMTAAFFYGPWKKFMGGGAAERSIAADAFVNPANRSFSGIVDAIANKAASVQLKRTMPLATAEAASIIGIQSAGDELVNQRAMGVAPENLDFKKAGIVGLEEGLKSIPVSVVMGAVGAARAKRMVREQYHKGVVDSLYTDGGTAGTGAERIAIGETTGGKAERAFNPGAVMQNVVNFPEGNLEAAKAVKEGRSVTPEMIDRMGLPKDMPVSEINRYFKVCDSVVGGDFAGKFDAFMKKGRPQPPEERVIGNDPTLSPSPEGKTSEAPAQEYAPVETKGPSTDIVTRFRNKNTKLADGLRGLGVEPVPFNIPTNDNGEMDFTTVKLDDGQEVQVMFDPDSKVSVTSLDDGTFTIQSTVSPDVNWSARSLEEALECANSIAMCNQMEEISSEANGQHEVASPETANAPVPEEQPEAASPEETKAFDKDQFGAMVASRVSAETALGTKPLADEQFLAVVEEMKAIAPEGVDATEMVTQAEIELRNRAVDAGIAKAEKPVEQKSEKDGGKDAPDLFSVIESESDKDSAESGELTVKSDSYYEGHREESASDRRRAVSALSSLKKIYNPKDNKGVIRQQGYVGEGKKFPTMAALKERIDELDEFTKKYREDGESKKSFDKRMSAVSQEKLNAVEIPDVLVNPRGAKKKRIDASNVSSVLSYLADKNHNNRSLGKAVDLVTKALPQAVGADGTRDKLKAAIAEAAPRLAKMKEAQKVGNIAKAKAAERMKVSEGQIDRYIDEGRGGLAFKMWAFGGGRVLSEPPVYGAGHAKAGLYQSGYEGSEELNAVMNGRSTAERNAIREILFGTERGEKQVGNEEMVSTLFNQATNESHADDVAGTNANPYENDYGKLISDTLKAVQEFKDWREEGAKSAEDEYYARQEEAERANTVEISDEPYHIDALESGAESSKAYDEAVGIVAKFSQESPEIQMFSKQNLVHGEPGDVIYFDHQDEVTFQFDSYDPETGILTLTDEGTFETKKYQVTDETATEIKEKENGREDEEGSDDDIAGYEEGELDGFEDDLPPADVEGGEGGEVSRRDRPRLAERGNGGELKSSLEGAYKAILANPDPNSAEYKRNVALLQEGRVVSAIDPSLVQTDNGVPIDVTSLRVENDTDAAIIFQNFFYNPKTEIAKVMFLGENGEVLGLEAIGFGKVGSAKWNADRMIESIPEGCAKVIVSHNHPSGIPTPSAIDRESTNELKNLVARKNPRVIVDHIITDTDRFFSLNENKETRAAIVDNDGANVVNPDSRVTATDENIRRVMAPLMSPEMPNMSYVIGIGGGLEKDGGNKILHVAMVPVDAKGLSDIIENKMTGARMFAIGVGKDGFPGIDSLVGSLDTRGMKMMPDGSKAPDGHIKYVYRDGELKRFSANEREKAVEALKATPVATEAAKPTQENRIPANETPAQTERREAFDKIADINGASFTRDGEFVWFHGYSAKMNPNKMLQGLGWSWNGRQRAYADRKAFAIPYSEIPKGSRLLEKIDESAGATERAIQKDREAYEKRVSMTPEEKAAEREQRAQTVREQRWAAEEKSDDQLKKQEDELFSDSSIDWDNLAEDTDEVWPDGVQVYEPTEETPRRMSMLDKVYNVLTDRTRHALRSGTVSTFDEYKSYMANAFGTNAAKIERFLPSVYNAVRIDVSDEVRSRMTPEVEVNRKAREAAGLPERGKDGVGHRVPSVTMEHLMPKPVERVTSSSFNGGLDADQRVGVNLALEAISKPGGSFMLADGTGFGKTRQLIAIAESFRNENPGSKVLIISENKDLLANEFVRDANALGVNMANFKTGTYNGLANGDFYHPDDMFPENWDLLVLDEAHNLANSGSQRTQAYMRLPVKHVVFATATPMDRVTDAAYFLARLNETNPQAIANSLGYKLTKMVNEKTGKEYEQAEELPGQDKDSIRLRIISERDKAIACGKMVRRAYPFLGNIAPKSYQMSEAHGNNERSIVEHYQSEIKRARNAKKIYLKGTNYYKGGLPKGVFPSRTNVAVRGDAEWQGVVSRKVKDLQDTMYSSVDKINEHYKAEEAARIAAEIVGANPNARVIIVGQQVGDQHIETGGLNLETGKPKIDLVGFGTKSVESKFGKAKAKYVIPSSLNKVEESLRAAGITNIARIDANHDRGAERDAFVSQQKPVLVMTDASGGTGINLDDTTGEHPTTMIVLAQNYSAKKVSQLMGRVSRKNTASVANVILLGNDSFADAHRANVSDKKLGVLQAIQGGADADSNLEMEEAESQLEEPTEGVVRNEEDSWSERVFAEDTEDAVRDIKSQVAQAGIVNTSKVEALSDKRLSSLAFLESGGENGIAAYTLLYMRSMGIGGRSLAYTDQRGKTQRMTLPGVFKNVFHVKEEHIPELCQRVWSDEVPKSLSNPKGVEAWSTRSPASVLTQYARFVKDDFFREADRDRLELVLDAPVVNRNGTKGSALIDSVRTANSVDRLSALMIGQDRFDRGRERALKKLRKVLSFVSDEKADFLSDIIHAMGVAEGIQGFTSKRWGERIPENGRVNILTPGVMRELAKRHPEIPEGQLEGRARQLFKDIDKVLSGVVMNRVKENEIDPSGAAFELRGEGFDREYERSAAGIINALELSGDSMSADFVELAEEGLTDTAIANRTGNLQGTVTKYLQRVKEDYHWIDPRKGGSLFGEEGDDEIMSSSSSLKKRQAESRTARIANMINRGVTLAGGKTKSSAAQQEFLGLFADEKPAPRPKVMSEEDQLADIVRVYDESGNAQETIAYAESKHGWPAERTLGEIRRLDRSSLSRAADRNNREIVANTRNAPVKGDVVPATYEEKRAAVQDMFFNKGGEEAAVQFAKEMYGWSEQLTKSEIERAQKLRASQGRVTQGRFDLISGSAKGNSRRLGVEVGIDPKEEAMMDSLAEKFDNDRDAMFRELRKRGYSENEAGAKISRWTERKWGPKPPNDDGPGGGVKVSVDKDGQFSFDFAEPTEDEFSRYTNAAIDEYRMSHNMAPLRTYGKLTTEMLQNAVERAKTNPREFHSDMMRMMENPNFALTPEEQAKFITYLDELKRNYDDVWMRRNAAEAAGNQGLAEEMQAVLNSMTPTLDRAQQANAKFGNIWGKAGRARQIAIKDDYSFTRVVSDAQRSAGRPLTDDERAVVDTLVKRLRNKQIELDQQRIEDMDALFDTLIRDWLKDAHAAVQGKMLEGKSNEEIARLYQNALRQLEFHGKKHGGLFMAVPNAKKYLNAIQRYHLAAHDIYNSDGTPNEKMAIEAIVRDLDSVGVTATEWQVRQALTDMGVSTVPPKTQLERDRRELNSLHLIEQQIAYIEKFDELPPVTGYQRDAPSAVLRELRKRRAMLIKEKGLDAEKEEGRLKSALDAAKTRIRNRIEELMLAIRKNEEIPREKREPRVDDELIRLKADYKAAKEAYDEAFPKSEQQKYEERVLRAMSALKRQIRDWDDRYARALGLDFSKEGKADGLNDPRLETLRAQRDAKKQAWQALHDAFFPEGTAEEINKKVQQRLKALDDRLVETERKIKDFENADTYEARVEALKGKPKKDPLRTPEIAAKEAEIARMKAEIEGFKRQLKEESAMPLVKGLRKFDKAVSFTRLLRTSMDISAVLTQGGMMTLRHPVEAAKGVLNAVKSLSPQKCDEINGFLMSDPWFKEFVEAGGHVYGGIDKPETFRGVDDSFVAKIPGIGHAVRASERAFTTYLNCFANSLYKEMASKGFGPSGPSKPQREALAAFVNHALGYGYTGGSNALVDFAVFAPRLVIGSMEMAFATDAWLAPLITKNLAEYNARERAQVAKRIGKEWLSAVAVGVAVQALLKLLIDNDEDLDWDDWIEFFTPGSDHFLRPTAGYSHVMVAMQRMVKWWNLSAKLATAERDENGTVTRGKGFGDSLQREIRKILSPVASLMWDAYDGKDFLGRRIDWGKLSLADVHEDRPDISGVFHVIENLGVPLYVADLASAYRHGGAKGAAAEAVPLMLGASIQHYRPKDAFDKAVAQGKDANSIIKDASDVGDRETVEEMKRKLSAKDSDTGITRGRVVNEASEVQKSMNKIDREKKKLEEELNRMRKFHDQTADGSDARVRYENAIIKLRGKMDELKSKREEVLERAKRFKWHGVDKWKE